MKKNRKRNSVILFTSILIIAGILFCYLELKKGAGSEVIITIDGKTYGVYSLNKDQKISIKDNGTYNLLAIKNGSIDMEQADCPDQLCVKQRKISRDGETIVCLPHKTVVRVRAGEKAQVDGVVN